MAQRERSRSTHCRWAFGSRDIQKSQQMDVKVNDMLRLATIDTFQGEESNAVILSTVRSNDAGRVGFMKTSNRINVACSRARNGFYIIGNTTVMGTVPMWAQIRDLMRAKGRIGRGFRLCCSMHRNVLCTVQHPSQWSQIPKCQLLCDFKYPCGHGCGRACHSAVIHQREGCTKPCERIYALCGHRCLKLCGEACGECAQKALSVKLDCGHVIELNCSEITEEKHLDSFNCMVSVGVKRLACGHNQEIICSKQNEKNLVPNLVANDFYAVILARNSAVFALRQASMDGANRRVRGAERLANTSAEHCATKEANVHRAIHHATKPANTDDARNHVDLSAILALKTWIGRASIGQLSKRFAHSPVFDLLATSPALKCYHVDTSVRASAVSFVQHAVCNVNLAKCRTASK